jgi:type IV pilus assembly protein PilM
MNIPFERYFVSQRTKPIVGVDIGSFSIKFAEVDISKVGKPKIVNIGSIRTPEGAVAGTNLVKPEAISEAILKLFQNYQVETTRVAFSLPSSSVFTKKISMPKSAVPGFIDNLTFEASNYIPHRIDAVNLDFQLVSLVGSTAEMLLVAVKKDFLAPYMKIFTDINLEPMIADVESFSLCNLFGQCILNEKKEIPTAIVDIGYRHTTVSLVNDGNFVLSGEINIGTKNYIDSLMDNLKITFEQASLIILGIQVQDVDDVLQNETMDRMHDYVGAELHRQIGFFWNGASQNKPIGQILLSGGGSGVQGLLPDLKSRFGISCEYIPLLENIELSSDIDREYFRELNNSVNVAIGLALRRSSDKPIIE